MVSPRRVANVSQAIALAATWDEDHLFKVATLSDEARKNTMFVVGLEVSGTDLRLPTSTSSVIRVGAEAWRHTGRPVSHGQDAISFIRVSRG